MSSSNSIGIFLEPFVTGATVARVNRGLFSGENSATARMHAAEEAAIRAAGVAALAAKKKA